MIDIRHVVLTPKKYTPRRPSTPGETLSSFVGGLLFTKPFAILNLPFSCLAVCQRGPYSRETAAVTPTLWNERTKCMSRDLTVNASHICHVDTH